MAESRKIVVIFSAQDDYSAILAKFNKALQDTANVSTDTDTVLSKLSATFKSLQAAWLEVTAVVASAAWIIAGAKNALDAEVSYNKLRIQVDNLGESFAKLEPSIQASIDATAEYAMVQDRDVTKVLQQLILQTGNLEAAQKSLNIVYDFAYLKGIDVGEATVIYSKAIAGNTEGLGRLVPELKDLEVQMGANATLAQKGAVAQQLISDKVKGATEKMIEHEREVRRVTLAYNELWQGVGAVTLELASFGLDLLAFSKEGMMAEAGIGTITDEFNLLGTSVADVAAEVADVDAKETWKDMAAGFKAANEALEHEVASLKAYVDLNKPLQEEYNRLTNEINKATLSKEDYLAVYALEQIAMGKDINLINAIVDVKRQLNTIEEQNTFQKNLEEVDRKITDVNKSIATTTGNTIDFITALVQEIVTLGATTEQVIAYVNALQKLAEVQGKVQQDALGYKRNLQIQKLMVDSYSGYYSKLATLHKEYGDEVVKQELQKTSVQLSLAEETFGLLADGMQNLTTIAGSEGGTAFEAMKAFAIAQAIIKTYLSATEAYAALAGIPIVGPALAVAAAAAAIAAGMANVKAISDTTPSSTTVSATGDTGYTDYTGGSYETTSVPTSTSTTAAQQTQSITVVINNPLSTDNWQQIVMDNIIPAINDATDRNVYLNVRRS